MVSLLHRVPDWKYRGNVYQIGPKWADSVRLVPDASDTRPIAKQEEKANVEGEVLAFEPKHVNVLLAYQRKLEYLFRLSSLLIIDDEELSCVKFHRNPSFVG